MQCATTNRGRLALQGWLLFTSVSKPTSTFRVLLIKLGTVEDVCLEFCAFLGSPLCQITKYRLSSQTVQ